MTSDWTKVSRDPISQGTYRYLKEALLARRAGAAFNYDDFLRRFVEGRSVLDIGVVEHDVKHMDADKWLHKKIKGWARETMGVDILEPEVKLLQERGYDVMAVDATSDADLGRRFERVVIGDVIEHVENPVALLRFAARHLEDGGLIVARTPNPYWVRFLWVFLREEVTIANAEHISWISPSMALEIGRRADLNLKEYWLLMSGGPTLLHRLFNRIRDRFFRYTEFLAPAFFYVYEKPRAPND